MADDREEQLMGMFKDIARRNRAEKARIAQANFAAWMSEVTDSDPAFGSWPTQTLSGMSYGQPFYRAGFPPCDDDVPLEDILGPATDYVVTDASDVVGTAERLLWGQGWSYE
jgi:hypothetical protein